MAVAILKKPVREFGPESAGTRMSTREFDQADFVEGWRYELINGVLVVTPIPLESERDPNGELGYLLRFYGHNHPQGNTLDKTLFEQTVKTRTNRRRADRVIWAGLGRRPERGERPTIIVEFVSAGKRDRKRDYEGKRDEYMALGVREYWVIDRFQMTMTGFTKKGSKIKKMVVAGAKNYTTDLLPGFELPLAALLKLANEWPDEPAAIN